MLAASVVLISLYINVVFDDKFIYTTHVLWACCTQPLGVPYINMELPEHLLKRLVKCTAYRKRNSGMSVELYLSARDSEEFNINHLDTVVVAIVNVKKNDSTREK